MLFSADDGAVAAAAAASSWLPVARAAALLGAILAFQLGMAPCFWIITTEIFPALDRADAMGAVYSLVFVASTAESAFAPRLTTAADVGVFALASAAAGLAAWARLRATLPETRHAVVGEDSLGGVEGDLERWGEADAVEHVDTEQKGLLAKQPSGRDLVPAAPALISVPDLSSQTAGV